MFVYLGTRKIASPVDFLKVIREYEMIPDSMPGLLNLVAAVLPWAEVLLGALLIVGVATRGTALITLVLLAVFTTAITVRALAEKEALGVPFCDIAFDCGCGTGVEQVCRKLPENGALLLLSCWVLATGAARFAVRPRLFA